MAKSEVTRKTKMKPGTKQFLKTLLLSGILAIVILAIIIMISELEILLGFSHRDDFGRTMVLFLAYLFPWFYLPSWLGFFDILGPWLNCFIFLTLIRFLRGKISKRKRGK